MKTKIILHGILEKKFGKEFYFYNINKPIDAVKSLNTIYNNFAQTIINHAKLGMHYELIVDGQTKTAKDMNERGQEIQTIEICPCILGEDIFTAAFWIAAGFSATTAAVIATTLTVLVVGIVVAGIVYLITPIPEVEPQGQETMVATNSFIFTSPNNVAAQGVTLPVGYGRLRVGSLVVSQTSKNFDLDEDFDVYSAGSKASSDLDILSRISNAQIRNVWQSKTN